MQPGSGQGRQGRGGGGRQGSRGGRPAPAPAPNNNHGRGRQAPGPAGPNNNNSSSNNNRVPGGGGRGNYNHPSNNNNNNNNDDGQQQQPQQQNHHTTRIANANNVTNNTANGNHRRLTYQQRGAAAITQQEKQPLLQEHQRQPRSDQIDTAAQQQQHQNHHHQQRQQGQSLQQRGPLILQQQRRQQNSSTTNGAASINNNNWGGRLCQRRASGQAQNNNNNNNNNNDVPSPIRDNEDDYSNANAGNYNNNSIQELLDRIASLNAVKAEYQAEYQAILKATQDQIEEAKFELEIALGNTTRATTSFPEKTEEDVDKVGKCEKELKDLDELKTKLDDAWKKSDEAAAKAKYYKVVAEGLQQQYNELADVVEQFRSGFMPAEQKCTALLLDGLEKPNGGHSKDQESHEENEPTIAGQTNDNAGSSNGSDADQSSEEEISDEGDGGGGGKNDQDLGNGGNIGGLLHKKEEQQQQQHEDGVGEVGNDGGAGSTSIYKIPPTRGAILKAVEAKVAQPKAELKMMKAIATATETCSPTRADNQATEILEDGADDHVQAEQGTETHAVDANDQMMPAQDVVRSAAREGARRAPGDVNNNNSTGHGGINFGSGNVGGNAQGTHNYAIQAIHNGGIPTTTTPPAAAPPPPPSGGVISGQGPSTTTNDGGYGRGGGRGTLESQADTGTLNDGDDGQYHATSSSFGGVGRPPTGNLKDDNNHDRGRDGDSFGRAGMDGQTCHLKTPTIEERKFNENNGGGFGETMESHPHWSDEATLDQMAAYTEQYDDLDDFEMAAFLGLIFEHGDGGGGGNMENTGNDGSGADHQDNGNSGDTGQNGEGGVGPGVDVDPVGPGVEVEPAGVILDQVGPVVDVEPGGVHYQDNGNGGDTGQNGEGGDCSGHPTPLVTDAASSHEDNPGDGAGADDPGEPDNQNQNQESLEDKFSRLFGDWDGF